MATSVVDTGGSERRVERLPQVTREQYEAGRALLDALPPGIYTKCTACGKWQQAGEIRISRQGVFCEGCGSVQ